ncbi:MAG TPA: bifunctional riboflavin kinase/FMN adenylyltransferase [Anaerolineaceae bacterium]|nr:bifunctional riboflavin kinase/FMN adenylyltransferase [Anaerolineaceae bacterium]
MDFIAPFDASLYKNAWLTIGSFDGVHLGHQSLIKGLVERAHAEDACALVITFWPHPATFFKRAPLAWALTSPEERRELICALGVEEVLTLNFSHELANLTALEFMQGLKENLGLHGLMVGPNFALGKNREGSIHKLTEIAAQLDFRLEIAQPITNAEGMVSSSQVRTDLLEGRVKPAAQKLGRPYKLSGKVVHGEHRGTGLGVPTANLDHQPERLIPGNGVYVTRALVNGKSYASVTNIGVRPTFDNPLPVPRIEPHILDLNEQLYGQDLALEFIDYLRPEIKFESSKELVAQIQKDIHKTRELFNSDTYNTTMH